jgi:hypothetical protein
MKEEAMFRVEGVVMLFGLHGRRAEVGRQDVDVDVPVDDQHVF